MWSFRFYANWNILKINVWKVIPRCCKLWTSINPARSKVNQFHRQRHLLLSTNFFFSFVWSSHNSVFFVARAHEIIFFLLQHKRTLFSLRRSESLAQLAVCYLFLRSSDKKTSYLCSVQFHWIAQMVLNIN